MTAEIDDIVCRYDTYSATSAIAIVPGEEVESIDEAIRRFCTDGIA